MSYANPLMLIGLAGVLIPIIIHLITQHKAKRVDWGAMLFLQESVVHRSRRMLLEQILLLITRCLLVGLVAMALALPFVRPESRVPWPFVLPAVLLGTAALGAGAALGQYRRWRWGMFAAGAVLFGLAIVASAADRWFGVGSALQQVGAQDVVIVIDGSDSMSLAVDGVTNFQTATAEAEQIVSAMRPGDAATIIVAGATLQTTPASPSRRVDELKQAITALSPPGGMMSAGDALAAAAAACKLGENVSKKIVVITDGQSAGWTGEGRINWEQLVAPLKKLPVPPAIVLRRLPLPKRINNAQMTDIVVSEGVVGPDREQAVDVRVENTGTEPINQAFDVELSLNNATQPLRQSVAKLLPGVAQSLTFHIQPQRGGLHSLSARVVRPDDLAWDNSAARVMRAFEQVPVLLVDGNATGRMRDRATWYLDLALAPDLPEERAKPRPSAGAAAIEDVPSSGLYRVTTVDLSKISSVEDLRPYRVIALADVPKLPTKTAVALADFVADGGGLLISLGSRCQKDFYNNWQARGAPLMPASLVERRVANSTQPAVHPQVGSFQHEALRVVGANSKTDLGTATITAYWQLKATPGDGGSQSCAALSSGDPWLMERRIGRGRVIVSSVSLDRTGSDLPSLQSFQPLVYEIVSHLTQLPTGGTEISLAGRQSVELRTLRGNLPSDANKAAEPPPAANASAATGGATPGQGLQAEYFSGADFRRRLLGRVDPTIGFQWPAAPIPGLADPAFSVRWTGTLVPTTTDTYTFTLEGEQSKLWVNGKLVAASAPPPAPPKPAAGAAPPAAPPVAAPQPAVSAPLELVGGRPYAIRLDHVGKAGQGKCELHWQGKQLGRQVVPAACLSPTVAWRVELARTETSDAPATLPGVLMGAAGAEHAAAIVARDDGATAYITDKLKPGLYRLRLPDSMREEFQELLIDDSLPVAVRSEPRESQLTVLSDADLAAAVGQASLTSAASVDDVVAQLSGRGPSQRLWRYLAIAALLLAVGEIALARWIAVQRMVGHEPQVVFAADATRSTISPAIERFSAARVSATLRKQETTP